MHSPHKRNIAHNTILTIVSIVMGSGMAFSAFAAEQLGSDDIAKKLAPKKPALTRSLVKDPNAAKPVSSEDQEFLKQATTRGIRFDLANKEKVYEIVDKYELPKLDFEIQFKFGSAQISPESVPQLQELAKALSTDTLLKSKVMLVGHTDSKGTNEFNQDLSEQRAQSVAAFLQTNGSIDAARITPFGYGEERLKNSFDSEAAENRRVEIINITTQ